MVSTTDSVKELTDLAGEIDRLYDTERTNALVEMVHGVVDELRQLRKCQCCPNEATRHLCDKPHQW